MKEPSSLVLVYNDVALSLFSAPFRLSSVGCIFVAGILERSSSAPLLVEPSALTAQEQGSKMHEEAHLEHFSAD